MIGLLTIGTTPRLDLMKIFREKIPSHVPITMLGALDGLTKKEIESLTELPGEFPLFVRTNDGSFVIQREALLPLLIEKGNRLAEQGAKVIILLCSGQFSPMIDIETLVILPTRLLEGATNSIAKNRKIGVVVPIEQQISYTDAKWRDYGFIPTTIFAHPLETNAKLIAEQFNLEEIEQIVLDCISFNPDLQHQLIEETNLPVWTPITLAIQVLTAFIRE